MLFRRFSRLKLTYTVANWPAADATYEELLGIPGITRPRQAYHLLKGSAADMTWPQGAAPFFFTYGTGFGNELLTDAFGHEFGIRSWSITASPGLVPGRLTVASYKTTNSDDAAPDATSDFNLGPGAWDSGPLPVQATTGAVHWRAPLIRWVPINLLSLL